MSLGMREEGTGVGSPPVDNYWIRRNKDVMKSECVFVFRYLKSVIILMSNFANTSIKLSMKCSIT